MSSRGVLIRIIALLQRKTLIETKNRTLKCLKWQYSTVPSMKNVAVLTEDGAFALFFRPHPGELGVWKSGNPESGIGTGIGTGTGTGTGMGRETYIKTGTTFTLI